ncbi:BON domain-containing protein [Methylobacter sp. BlB1]|uniref:BON domain-containing protein n=1 Tax=Methylobacter sp. BlB1 TaxID=2785914 RepID=UPI0018936F14|nr:BON domain-containing protein [Methylobacter sp. BlB1]MBF6649279.1 BON domain-containing protein [Methylobacter sp. BlB1]
MKTKNTHKGTSLSDRVLVILSIATGLAGCAQDGPGRAERTDRQIGQTASRAGEIVQEPQRPLDEQTEKAGAHINDAAISNHIKNDLLNDPLLALSNINVTTTAGAVTLSGIVNSQQAMDRAVEIARRHPDVKSVENKLLIKAPSRI